MIALALAALALATPRSGDQPVRADVRVTASDADGGADAGLANALVQALVDAGLSAAPERHPPGDCRDGCVRVSARKTRDRGFVIEVRTGAELALEVVRLDPTATPFDQVHALAIEVELLAGRMHAPRRRHARSSLASAAPPVPVRPQAVDGAADDDAPPPATSSEPPAPPADDRATRALADREVPAVREQAQPKAAPSDEHLALNVAAMILAGTSGGLFMHGSTLGARVRVTHRLDARASICFLRPQEVERLGARYRLELLPLAAAVTAEIPGVPALRAGGGVEGLLVSDEWSGREGSSYWAFGPIARLEYRLAIRSFALLSSVQAAVHPGSWNTERDAGPLAAIPPWTVGASLGLEFRVF